jgi:hypothetical protein
MASCVDGAILLEVVGNWGEPRRVSTVMVSTSMRTAENIDVSVLLVIHKRYSTNLTGKKLI